MRRLLLSILLPLAACSYANLQRTGDAMLRAERATQAVSDGVIAFKDATKEECIRQNLATEAQRAACVERAVQALEVTRVGVASVAAALTTFWESYAVIESRLNAGGRVTQHDVLVLAGHGARVTEAYAKLVREIEEVRR